MTAAARTIDAHLHLWQVRDDAYSWLTPELGVLYQDFDIEQARTELDAAGFDGAGIDAAILVQADDTRADTDFMLATADENPWVIGVVGWVPLDTPDAAEPELERLLQHPAFCGIRHLIHDDPRDDFLSLPTVRTSLAMLAKHGLAFDIPNAWPRHLGPAVELVGSMPELQIVVDHLGKPPLGEGVDSDAYAQWRRDMQRIAASDTTVAKLSGLHLPGVAYTAEALRPLWEDALELFGPSRLLYGGDWPITVAGGGYLATWNVLAEFIAELSPDEQAAVLGGNAERVYRRS